MHSYRLLFYFEFPKPWTEHNQDHHLLKIKIKITLCKWWCIWYLMFFKSTSSLQKCLVFICLWSSSDHLFLYDPSSQKNHWNIAPYMLNCKHHMQLGPDDSVSFPAIYGVNKVRCSFFFNSYVIYKKKEYSTLLTNTEPNLFILLALHHCANNVWRLATFSLTAKGTEIKSRFFNRIIHKNA